MKKCYDFISEYGNFYILFRVSPYAVDQRIQVAGQGCKGVVERVRPHQFADASVRALQSAGKGPDRVGHAFQVGFIQ